MVSSSWSEVALIMLRMLFPDDSKGCESIRVQLKLFNTKPLNIASFNGPLFSWYESLTLIHNDIGNTMRK